MSSSLLKSQKDLNKPTDVQRLSFEQLLEEAVTYGRPHLHCSKEKTWSVTIEMWVNASNVTFEVKSGFGHESAYGALYLAVTSAREALNSFNNRKS